MIYFKEGIYANQLRHTTIMAINAAHDVMLTLNKNLTITSLADGKHMSKSKHYQDLAVDIRTHELDDDEKLQVTHDIQYRLGNKFQVILESTHIHIEHDPK